MNTRNAQNAQIDLLSDEELNTVSGGRDGFR